MISKVEKAFLSASVFPFFFFFDIKHQTEIELKFFLLLNLTKSHFGDD